MKRSIGIFDSGIGGFTILEELKKTLPNENFIYYEDTKNNPYGEKEEEEIYLIAKNIVDYLLSLDVKMIVIACNTVTTICMKRFKKEYPNMLFVGTVPAIKVACDRNLKNILVMATPSTIKSNRTYELVRDNKGSNQNIILASCDGLAKLIEDNDHEKINNRLAEIFKDYIDLNIDSIVLGCTHYPLIKDNIRKVFPNTLLLDSSVGVAKEVKRQLEKNYLINNEGNGEVKIIDSLKSSLL